MLTPTKQELAELQLGILIDRFNQPCQSDWCRVTTHYTSERFCPAHQAYYDELKRRQDFIRNGVG